MKQLGKNQQKTSRAMPNNIETNNDRRYGSFS